MLLSEGVIDNIMLPVQVTSLYRRLFNLCRNSPEVYKDILDSLI